VLGRRGVVHGNLGGHARVRVLRSESGGCEDGGAGAGDCC
jgi:hypothetical protein